MSLTMECLNEQDEIEISRELIGKLEVILNKAGKMEGVISGEVALSFVNDEDMRHLNKTYREIDSATDVLSFAMQETTMDEMKIIYNEEDKEAAALRDYLGDIIISVPRAKQQSEEYGHSLEREIGFLFVHGFLHLIGYDHQDEASETEMFAKQELILQEAGLTR